MSGIPKLASFINKSRVTQKILKGVDNNPAVFSACVSFGLASILRPALIGCFKFNDKEDKKYSQASAVATGLVELGTTVALFLPLNKYLSKTANSLYKTPGTFYSGNEQVLNKFKNVSNRGVKLLALIPISFARFSLVKPLVNNVFNKFEDKKGLDVKA